MNYLRASLPESRHSSVMTPLQALCKCVKIGALFALLAASFTASADTQTRTLAGSAVGANWSNIGNAVSIDGTCAFPNDVSPAPVLLTDWGFAIPAGATINGISVRVQGGSTAGNNDVQLIQGGTTQGSSFNAGISGGSCPGTDATVGGPAELWGLAWTDADINAADFGVEYRAEFQGRQFDGAEVTIDFTPAGAEADLSISKTADPSPATAGANLTYTLTVDNAGPSDADNVVITDNLPAGLTLTATSGCAEDPNGVPTCSLGTIVAGGSAMATITAVVDADLADGSNLSNTASVTSDTPDSNPVNDSATDVTTVGRTVDIAVAVAESVDPVVAGSGVGNLVYTVTATNTGPSVASGLTIDLTTVTPAGVTVDSIDTTDGSEAGGVWTIGDLAVDATAQLTITMTVALATAEGTDTVSASGTVSGLNETDSNPANDTATEATSVRWPFAEFVVTKTFTDGSLSEVNVWLECTSGNFPGPGNPVSTVGQVATLTVTQFEMGATCSVFEQVPAGNFEQYQGDCVDVGVADTVAYTCAVTNAKAQATFSVRKRFMDGNDETPVTLHIQCNTGLPLSQSLTVLPGQGDFDPGEFEVKFVVNDFTPGVMDCTVWEDDIGNYTASYNCGATGNPDAVCNDGDPSPLDDYGTGPCEFFDVDSADAEASMNFCEIRNYPDPAVFTVNKIWDVVGQDNDAVDQFAQVTIWCNAEIENGFMNGNNWYRTFSDTGDFSATVTIVPDFPYSQCWAEEYVADDAVETQNDCDTHDLSAGAEASCDIYNTVFFEGIPTLSQYGLAILALLMLGVGMVGFRRFA